MKHIIILCIILSACAFKAVAALLPDPVAGYEILYGHDSGAYTHKIDVGLATSHTFTNLPPGPVFAVVIAYNAAGVRGRPSAEISYIIPVAASPPAIECVDIETSTDNVTWTLRARVPLYPQEQPAQLIRARIHAIKPE